MSKIAQLDGKIKKIVMEDNKFSTFLNYAACFVILVCIIGIVYGMIAYFTQSKDIQEYQIVLTVSPDSIYNGEKFSYYTDSLIQVINRHEHVIEERYNAILEEKYNTQQYWTIAGVLTTVVITILGFFGYKSFKDIETKCVDISKTTTTKIVRRSLGSIVKSQMNDDNFSSDIIKAVRNEIENSTLKNIENRLSALEDPDGADTLPIDDSDTEQDPEIPSLPDNPEEASI